MEHGHCLEQSLQNLLSMRNLSITTSRMKVDMEERFPSLRISLDCGVFRKAVVSGSAEGNEYGFGELEIMAKEAPALQSFIDPDAPEFTPAGDIPTRIREFCKKTGQPVPEIRRRSCSLHQPESCNEISSCDGRD